MPAPDRLQLLLAQSAVTGIDFVYVSVNPVTFFATLDVYFLRDPSTLDVPLVGNVTIDQVQIYRPSQADVQPVIPVTALAWTIVDGRPVLRLTTKDPHDFARYRFRLTDARIDAYFNDVSFTFKAQCPSDLDCKPPPHVCPPEEDVDFPIDYRARDFWSFRRALLDFAAQRYPDWTDRLEADVGVMLAEVMSALGDELAYYQDRVAREAYLETATQRRSLRRHARLVDYPVHDGRAGYTWLDVTVRTGQNGTLLAGANVWAASGSNQDLNCRRQGIVEALQADSLISIPAGCGPYYEVGRGVRELATDTAAAKGYPVGAARNSFAPHIWDEDDACLPVGTTELFIKGHHQAVLPFNDVPPAGPPGRWMLLRTDPTDPSIPERRLMVRVIDIEDSNDPLINDPQTGNSITRLAWEDEQALPFEMDLTTLTVRGNLVPATAGITFEGRFVVGMDPEDLAVPAAEQATLRRVVERDGPNDTIAYLYSLPGSEDIPLSWQGDDPRATHPEVRLVEIAYNGAVWVEQGPDWTWKRSMLGTFSSQPDDRHFTLDDGVWKRVVGYQRIDREIVHVDYADGAGKTIRFGDDAFGLVPAEGTVFEITYRLGNGKTGNVAADTLTHFDTKDPTLGFVEAVTNPLPAVNGLDAETPQQARQLAPEAFRAITYRAVRPEDYAEAAQRLPWVQRAGTTFRWTGSWLSAFTTPDPLGAATVSAVQRTDLRNQLDRFRQAGREAHTADPIYADLDLTVTVCVAPYAYRGEVKEAVLEVLLGTSSVASRRGFFSPDNFTFGAPLNRPVLEAAIQAVPGVRAVEGMTIRRRGWFAERAFNELAYEVGMNEVIRVENDRLHPGRGSVRLIMEGGA